MFCVVALYSLTLFHLLVPFKPVRPDVRTFLLMDKMQNLSDASEDEDDKASTLATDFDGLIFLYN